MAHSITAAAAAAASAPIVVVPGFVELKKRILGLNASSAEDVENLKQDFFRYMKDTRNFSEKIEGVYRGTTQSQAAKYEDEKLNQINELYRDLVGVLLKHELDLASDPAKKMRCLKEIFADMNDRIEKGHLRPSIENVLKISFKILQREILISRYTELVMDTTGRTISDLKQEIRALIKDASFDTKIPQELLEEFLTKVSDPSRDSNQIECDKITILSRRLIGWANAMSAAFNVFSDKGSASSVENQDIFWDGEVLKEIVNHTEIVTAEQAEAYQKVAKYRKIKSITTQLLGDVQEEIKSNEKSRGLKGIISCIRSSNLTPLEPLQQQVKQRVSLVQDQLRDDFHVRGNTLFPILKI